MRAASVISIRRAAVNELSPELDGVRQTLVVQGENPAANPVARLEDTSAQAAFFQLPHRRQPSNAGADDCDIDLSGRSIDVCCFGHR